MSAKQPLGTKGEIMINPVTKRPIKVGSRAWLKLVKDGILHGEYVDDHVIGEFNADDETHKLQERIKALNKNQEPGVHVVKGRGVYKNKLVKRSKQLTPQEVSKKTSKIASKLITNNEDDELEAELESMIYNELMQGKPKKIPKPAPVKRGPKPKGVQLTRSKTAPIKKRQPVQEYEQEDASENTQDDYTDAYTTQLDTETETEPDYQIPYDSDSN